MNDHLDAKGKVRRAVTTVAGATVSEVLGNVLIPNSPSATPAAETTAAPVHEAAAATESSAREWVPETESSSVSRGEDGSVEAKTSTVWHPETQGGTEAPPEDLPTIEEFEQIEVHEDEFGNFIIDATERVVVHNHGHDETYVDHQHLVVPGDGTPGDTDLDIVEHEDVIVHENPDGSISVEHSGSITVETHPDAPGHGDIEVWQEESVVLDEAPTGPPGIEVGIGEDEQAFAEDPFGEPAGPTIHQTESVTDKGKTVTTTVTAPAPSLPAPPSMASVAFSRAPSTVDTTPVAQPLLAETKLVASATLAEPPVTKHVEPKETFAPEHHPAKHSFATDPPGEKHDPGELSGPKPVPEEHQPGELTGPKPVPEEHHQDVPKVEEHAPVHEEPPVQEAPQGQHPHDQQTPVEEPPAPEMPDHEPFHQAHADGGG